MRSLLLGLFAVVSSQAFAFPEMVRHGYTQCTACHVSPSGGGILTSYGRELAAEVLSTWSYADESQFTHSKVGEKLADKGILFGGDVLFAGSIGRTDIPGADHKLLIRGIREKVLTLPDETAVLSGHGPRTTIGEERRNNPFLQ